jgi:hypothetical protein
VIVTGLLESCGYKYTDTREDGWNSCIASPISGDAQPRVSNFSKPKQIDFRSHK